MNLKAPCEHGRYDEHVTRRDNYNDPMQATETCPGGSLLPSDTLVIQRSVAREALKDVLWNAKGYTFDSILDALAAAQPGKVAWTLGIGPGRE